MGKLLNHLFGLLGPDAGSRRDLPAERQPVRRIDGAQNARELCMLPVDANPPGGNPRMPHEKSVVQLKADGIRALYIHGTIVSREGAPLDCALHCQPGIARMVQAAGVGPLMFDGEYVAHDGFNATLAEHKAGKGDGVFWAFDVMPVADWVAGRCSIPIEDRLALLRDLIVKDCDSLFVGMLDAWTLNAAETAAKAREIWAAGGEGVVSKRLGSPYVRERSDDWLRIKETLTVDGVVTDLFADSKTGDLKSMMVRTEHGPIAVGTGWTKAEGRTLLAMDAGALGDAKMWVEISFQRSTGAKRSIRGARFHRVRMSKGARA
jgi:ATP-dependent DNA ligase